MSQVDAKSFLERVTRDPGLRLAAVTELEGKTGSNSQRLIELGAQHGLTFTETELVDAWKEFQSTDQRALSDSELDGATGGTASLSKLLEAACKGTVFKKVEL